MVVNRPHPKFLVINNPCRRVVVLAANEAPVIVLGRIDQMPENFLSAPFQRVSSECKSVFSEIIKFDLVFANNVSKFLYSRFHFLHWLPFCTGINAEYLAHFIK